MPLAPGGSIMLCAVQSTLQESVLVNTFAFRAATQVLSPQGAHNAFVLHMTSTVLPKFVLCQTTDVVYTMVKTSVSTMTNMFAQIISAVQAVTGTLDEPTAPSSVSAVLTKRSLMAGRKNRGRIYLGGNPNAKFTQQTGKWTGAYQALLQDAADRLHIDFTDATNTTTWTPIVINKTFTSFADISSGTVNPAPRNQRRRQPGVGV